LRAVKRQIEGREIGARPEVRIPAVARAHEKVAVAGVEQDVLSLVVQAQERRLSDGKGLRKDRGEVPVFVLVLLDEGNRRPRALRGRGTRESGALGPPAAGATPGPEGGRRPRGATGGGGGPGGGGAKGPAVGALIRVFFFAAVAVVPPGVPPRARSGNNPPAA